jgi:hypothetical protein
MQHHQGCVLFCLLLSLEAADSTGRGDKAHVRSVLDMSAEQHTDHVGPQPTCGGEVRGKSFS